MTVRNAALITGVVLLSLVGGCSANGQSVSPDSDPASLPAVTGAPEDWDALRDQALAQEAEALGVAVPEDVTFVRYIHAEEYGTVHARCMNEQGFPATETFDGGVSYGQIPDDQGEAQRIASIRCNVQYPVHPRFALPPSEEQLRVTYEYYVASLTPCLESAGYAVGTVPTWQTFLETYFTDEAWAPYFAAGVGDIAQTPDAWREINERCPQSPPLADLFD